MSNFNDHCDHALQNIKFVENVSSDYTHELRWKITASYYTAYHLIQAHVASKVNALPDTHEKLKVLIAPSSVFTTVKLGGNLYATYLDLENLSRKARYSSHVNITERHFCEAISYLDEIIEYFSTLYPLVPIPHTQVYCTSSALCAKHKHLEVLEKVA